MTVKRAKGSYIYDEQDKAYLDFVAGVSACTLGHSHPAVVKAVKDQMDKYAHVMVYGEYVQQPALELCKLLADQLPPELSTTYLVNSGTEAMEGAMKLARRVTGRSKFLYADKAYHGNTYGSLSIMGYEPRKAPFEPMLPDCHAIPFNDKEALDKIDENTAAVILETIQGGAGFILPELGYLEAVRKRCDQVGAMLILDEIQPGFGRTGKLFGFEHYGIQPDILVIGKGMGGGLPIGAFIGSHDDMQLLADNPKLGHITTFGGHPVIAAAALATLKELLNTDLIPGTLEKEILIREQLKHPLIKEVRGRGLMLAFMLEDPEQVNRLILTCQDRGLILFWLLFEPCAVRVTPPLTVSEEEIMAGCQLIRTVLDEIAASS
ncbi:aspartate aminotransferase family protein [Aureitalea marina]|uniref:Aspartate aminotransferase family protein n=2 Tax=Aureitalea marina TaxID=930804 RepID=A0A2S7KTP4_9FLAO|nr:aspartate aminotransferase family protein [Aureitalea marina]